MAIRARTRTAPRSDHDFDGFQNALGFDVEIQLVILRDKTSVHRANADRVKPLEGFLHQRRPFKDRLEDRIPIVLLNDDRDVVGKTSIGDQWPFGLALVPGFLPLGTIGFRSCIATFGPGGSGMRRSKRGTIVGPMSFIGRGSCCVASDHAD